MKAYRIRDWAKLYENNRTRHLKRMDWVPIPNKHDGDGFADLLDHPEGMAHFGAWVLIVQVASKCEPRGTLMREAGTMPLDAGSIARRCRADASIIESALPRLVQIGWLETFEAASPLGRTDPASRCDDPAGRCDTVTIEGKGREGDGREGSPAAPPHPIPMHAAAPRRDAQAMAADPESRWVFERREPWARAVAEVVQNRLAASSWPAWKRLVDRHGLASVVAAANALKPDARWPDRVETYLLENAPPPPEPVDAELARAGALVGRHGWQSCLAVLRIPNVKSAEVLQIALDSNRALCRMLIGHYEGGTAAGAGAA